MNSLLSILSLSALGILYWQKQNFSKKTRNFEKTIAILMENKKSIQREATEKINQNTQLISSILHIQGEYSHTPKNQQKLKKINTQVLSLFKISTNAVKEAKTFKKILTEEMIALTQQNKDIKYSILGNDFSVSNTELQYFIFILHELVNNSINHAWKKENITKEIFIEILQSNNSTIISYQDNGTGIPLHKWKECTKGGLKIIKDFTKKKLGGFITTFKRSGYISRIEIVVPINKNIAMN